MLGAVVAAKFSYLRDGVPRVDEPFLCKPYPCVYYFFHTCIAESILVDRLEPGPAQVDLGCHYVYGPILLRMVHYLSSKLRELVAVGSGLYVFRFCRQLGYRQLEKILKSLALLLSVVGFALPCYELNKVMYELRVGGREKDILLGEVGDELLV